jgi:Mechanosensitive ion channel, conserved TM helix
MKDMILHGFQQAHQNFEHMLAEFLPRFIVMLIIILFGWLVAYVLKFILRAILKITPIDRVSEEAGASRLLRRADLPSVSELLSRALFWVVWLGFIVVAVSVLEIVSLQQQISNLIGLLPQIFVAFFVIFIGFLAANFFSRAVLLASVNAGLPSPRLLSETVRIVVGLLALSMALEQIGLGRQTILIAFSMVFGGLMLGLAIAFGMGGRDLAKRTLEKHFLHEGKENEDEPSPL